MTAAQAETCAQVPDDIARQIVLPEGHLDEEALFSAYEWLRKNAPLAKAEVEGYDPLWLVSKHADILEIERQPQVFHNAGGSDNPGSHNPILNTTAGDAWTRKTHGTLRTLESLQMMDPPEHTLIRDIAQGWFKPMELKKWDDRIRQLANHVISQRLAPGINEVDFSRQFAWFYPLHVIMTLFGVPAEDEPLIMKLAHERFGANDPESRRQDLGGDAATAAAQQNSANIQDFEAYYINLVESLRSSPQDNLASLIANARQGNGDYYPMKTCIGYYIAISGAGHDTTSTTAATIFEQLAKHPDQLKAVQNDLSLIPALINEGLRWASPVKHFVHQAATDYELRGSKIRAGDRMMLLFQSANRDEDIFAEPAKFRHDRKPNPHIAFGSGPHSCLGQPLARLELRVLLEELLPRVRNIELTGPRKVLQTNFVGGLKSLPVRFELVD
ncbi:cytochrome P450 [Pseudarthrobacter sp902506025]|uniref:Cytochrome P450 n=1 Tax=Pseudarthrobacter defluvii TaxID=410837 RepID=A0ABT9UMD6_9MICC|nr:cytochrome P450 [Pseudarthrobacter defluvii]MDQ0120816.1 cytochrome P450 [Pseudarthrobacter defluvii]